MQIKLACFFCNSNMWFFKDETGFADVLGKSASDAILKISKRTDLVLAVSDSPPPRECYVASLDGPGVCETYQVPSQIYNFRGDPVAICTSRLLRYFHTIPPYLYVWISK